MLGNGLAFGTHIPVFPHEVPGMLLLSVSDRLPIPSTNQNARFCIMFSLLSLLNKKLIWVIDMHVDRFLMCNPILKLSAQIGWKICGVNLINKTGFRHEHRVKNHGFGQESFSELLQSCATEGSHISLSVVLYCWWINQDCSFFCSTVGEAELGFP